MKYGPFVYTYSDYGFGVSASLPSPTLEFGKSSSSPEALSGGALNASFNMGVGLTVSLGLNGLSLSGHNSTLCGGPDKALEDGKIIVVALFMRTAVRNIPG